MGQTSATLGAILFLPLAGAIINGLFGRRLPKPAVAGIACLTVLTAFGLTVMNWLTLRSAAADGDYQFLATQLWTWMDSGALKVQFSLMMDPLSAVMTLVVTGVGFLIHLFSIGYMEEDPAYWRYFTYLNLFMFSMLALVLGSNLLMLFLGWEGVGLCSYLLIGFWFTDEQKAAAGMKAFIVNRIGDFGFLIGLFMLLFYVGGNLEYVHLQELFASPSTAPLRDPLTITLICLFMFIGATGKSAQIPLYVWLPDAMAGPTPVSALIHAATMVTAGVYMISRLNFLYVLSPVALATIATIGAATALFAATMGVLQRDIKKVLAYSTVSQLGFMFLAVGVGAFGPAVFHLMTHAFFKACLFLGSGAIIHALHHEQDIFKMGNLKAKLPVVHITFLLATMAIAGVPGLAGFWSKEAILHGAMEHQITTNAALLTPWGLADYAGAYHGYFQILGVVGLLAAFCTAFYMFRLYFLTFWGQYRGDEHTWSHIHVPGAAMRIPLIVLGLLSVGGGYIALDGWLHPVLERGHEMVTVVEGHGGLAGILLYLSLAVAFGGIGLAWFLYMGPGKSIPAQLQRGLRGVYELVFNKYYVDEIYDAIIVRPLSGAAQFLFRFFDRFAIDTIGVHGVPWVLMTTGRLVRFVQNGDVQRYAAMMVIGLAALLYFIR